MVVRATGRSAHDMPPLPLDGATVATAAQPDVAVGTCATHLGLLGARPAPTVVAPGELTLLPPSGDALGALDCIVRWRCPPGEAIVQAVSGLMAVHGRDQRSPRRLGLRVASVAAGIVAAQGVLAALIASSRGQPVRGIETSVLQAGLLFVIHHLAIATCGDEFPHRLEEATAGPPFPTADGQWVELEVLTGDAWVEFWRRLDAGPDASVGRAWLPFVYRYLAGRCALPAAFHDATRRHTLAQLRSVADACGVALCQLRTHQELLASLPADSGVPWTIRLGSPQVGADQRPGLPGHGPLSGLRVVEATSRLQGPLAGLLLRFLGADVVKVEPPGGDFGRASPPLAGSVGAAYLAYNRGKQVVELDLKRPDGRAGMLDLAAGADVFLHNWRPGRAETLGLDSRDLSRHNPGLVYAHASGWGRNVEGPCQIAGDYLVQAYAGCGQRLNPPEEPPFPSRLTLLDVTGGLLACEAILAGLYLRERTGRGARVDTSLLAAAIALQARELRAAAAGEERGPRWSRLDMPLATADGFLTVAADGGPVRQRLADVCGLPPDETGEVLEELIAARLRDWPAVDWERAFLDAGIPAAAANCDLAAMSSDPRIAGLLEPVEGACWVPAAPWRFAG